MTTYVLPLLLAVATTLRNILPSSLRSTLPDWATGRTVSLGLDLQGDAHLLLAVDGEDLASSRLEERRSALVDEMRALDVNPAAVRIAERSLSAPASGALLAAVEGIAGATMQPGPPR